MRAFFAGLHLAMAVYSTFLALEYEGLAFYLGAAASAFNYGVALVHILLFQKELK